MANEVCILGDLEAAQKLGSKLSNFQLRLDSGSSLKHARPSVLMT